MKELQIMGNQTDVRIETLGEKASIFTKSLTYNTQRAYSKDIKDFFGTETLAEITIEQILNIDSSVGNQYTLSLKERGYAQSTINRKLISLSKFYSFLCRKEIGMMDYNPFSTQEGSKRVKQNKKYSNTRCLSVDEVKLLVRTAMNTKNTPVNLRNRIITLMLATCGTRREEIVSIKIKDIKKSMGKVVVEITGKGEKERIIVISDMLKDLIDEYLKSRNLTYKYDGEKYLLGNHTSNADHFTSDGITPQTVYNVVKALAEKSGLGSDTISPHCFRHSWVTTSLDLGTPINDVADMAGHSSTNTTRRYDHSKRVVLNNPAEKLTNMFMDNE